MLLVSAAGSGSCLLRRTEGRGGRACFPFALRSEFGKILCILTQESAEGASKEETPAVKEGSPEVGAEAAVEAGEASKESAEGTSAAPDAEPKPAEPAAESAGATEETEAVADSSADPAKGAEPAADADPAGAAAEPSDAPGRPRVLFQAG